MSDHPTKGNNCVSQGGNVPEHETAGDESFRCEQCNKCFKTKANLRQHKRIHTDERPFKCNYCFKCFRHKGHLNEHKRIHTGEKPFNCNQCGKRFNRKGLLNQHRRTHTEEKRYNGSKADQLLNDQGSLPTLKILPQHVITDEQDKSFLQGNNLENQGLIWEREAERTHVPGESCKYEEHEKMVHLIYLFKFK